MTACAGIPDGDPRPERTRRGQRWTDQPLTAAQQALAAEWVGIARGKARQWSKHRPHLHDEFVSAALYSVCEAARNFDATIGVTFFTYLKWHLRDAYGEVVAQTVPKGYRLTGCLRHDPEAIAERQHLPKFFEVDLDLDGAEVGRDAVGERDQRAADRARLARVLATLSPPQRLVADLHLVQGQSRRDTARALGVSVDRVSSVVRSVLKVLGLRRGWGGVLAPVEPLGDGRR